MTDWWPHNQNISTRDGLCVRWVRLVYDFSKWCALKMILAVKYCGYFFPCAIYLLFVSKHIIISLSPLMSCVYGTHETRQLNFCVYHPLFVTFTGQNCSFRINKTDNMLSMCIVVSINLLDSTVLFFRLFSHSFHFKPDRYSNTRFLILIKQHFPCIFFE